MLDPTADSDQDVDASKPEGAKEPFDFDTFPVNTLFHDRRAGRERRGPGPAGRSSAPAENLTPRAPSERRARKERRRRIDPTTFEKQYSEDEMEFMNAMQRFKVQSGSGFPSHDEVLQVAYSLGYRKIGQTDDASDSSTDAPLDATAELPGTCVDPLGTPR
jgi:hypothetical protein